MEDAPAYFEPRYWYYPPRQSLRAMHILTGDLDRAEETFRASLVRTPNNGWVLYGLMEVYKRRGDEKSVRVTKLLLDEAWMGVPRDLSLARL